jgi:formylglycine-generating enzyme required for sulfatase activity
MVNLKKKSSPSRRSHNTSGLKRVIVVLFIILGCAGVLAFFWFLSQLGPKEVDYRTLDTSVEISTEVQVLREQSIEYEAQFEETMAMREAEGQDVELLKRALDLQVQYLDALPAFDSGASKRRENLEQRYQDLEGARLKASSEELEAEAQKLANANAYEAARDKYQEAFALQKLINEDFALSSSYNAGRATRLQRQARYLTAEPLLKRSLDLENQADTFIAKKDWAEAEELLKQSIAIQDRLNREYRGTNQASVSRLERLKVKLVGIQSGQYQLEIEQVSDLADARRAEGETLEAASLYQEVARLQKQLNEAYPDSPYASSERVVEFQRKSQTAQSFELGVEIENNHDLLKRLLSERRTYEAAEVIVALRRDIKQMEEAFPRSSLNDEELQVKVRYLNLVQNDLGFIQDRVYDALLPVPDAAGLRMLRTEVPQALYALIMGTNPSRNRGDVNPVDSVSWTEAKSFCERLSWIMGKEVRLPTENEFRQALGRLRYVVLEEHVWSVSDADGVAQPVGTKAPFASGFYDLLGNVSEWLESIDRFESEDARHVGGHAQDRLESIFTVPMREAPRGERNRMTGFRLVVGVD